MENHHAIKGKIQYKWQFSIAMLVYQRVTSSCCWLKPFYNGSVSVYWCQYLSVISPTDHKQMAENHLPGQPNDLKLQIIHDSSLE